MKEILEAPEYATAKSLYNTRPLLLDFFMKIFTPGNFFAVWKYMEGYVEYKGSTELGQYYMRCPSPFTVMAFSNVFWLSSNICEPCYRTEALP